MKTSRIYLTLALFAAPLLSIGQDAISKYFSTYEADPSCTVVSVSGKMFQLFTHIDGETPEEKELMKTMSSLSSLKFVVNEKAANAKTSYATATKKQMPGFELLMSVQDQGESISFFINEQSGIVKELVMIGASEQEFYLMSIMGNIDLKQLSKLAHVVKIDGMDKLDNLNK
jgi:Domain of unknown function (DUF4252)